MKEGKGQTECFLHRFLLMGLMEEEEEEEEEGVREEKEKEEEGRGRSASLPRTPRG